ncbi:hypothetical protein JNM87_01330 [Candidatus Saccharibacteria bacterium]|nr:hypothetical protein [Candidatus Saccharibacteria bacterium]
MTAASLSVAQECRASILAGCMRDAGVCINETSTMPPGLARLDTVLGWAGVVLDMREQLAAISDYAPPQEDV